MSLSKEKRNEITIALCLLALVILGFLLGRIITGYFGSYLIAGEGLTTTEIPVNLNCKDCLYLLIRDCKNKTTIYYFENIHTIDPNFINETPVDIVWDNHQDQYKTIKDIKIRKKFNC